MTTVLRVLLIEDSEDDALLIARLLKQGNYRLQLHRVDTAEAMRKAMLENTWDLVISDYSMPTFGGRDALEILKETGQDIPFILVSGAIGEEIAIDAMKAGAHDYLMKDKLSRLVPAVRRELKEARIRAEQRRAEVQLRKLSRAIEQNLAAVIITDAQGHIEYVNPQFEQLTGYSLEDMRGKVAHFATIMAQELTMDASLPHPQLTQREWKREFLGYKKDGSTYWVSASVSQLYDQYGRVTNLVAIEEDITSRKHIELENHHREARRKRQHKALVYLTTHSALAEGQPEAYHIIAQKTTEALQVTQVTLWQLHDSGREFLALASSPKDTKARPANLSMEQFPKCFAAILAGQIIDTSNVHHDPRLKELVSSFLKHTVAVLAVPVRLYGKIAGIVCCEHTESHEWQDDEKVFIGQIAGLVSQTMLNANLRRRANELAIITRISREITSVPDLHRILKIIAQNATELLHADTGGLYILRENGRLYVEEFHGVDEALIHYINTHDIRWEEGCIRDAIAKHLPIKISVPPSNIICDRAPASLLKEIRAVLSVPILQGEQALGGITLWYHDPHHFTADEITFIQALAQQCVNAIVNARLFEAEARRRQEAETLYKVVQALSSTLNLDKVLELIISELQKVVPYDRASIQQLEDDRMIIIGGRGFTELEQVVGKTSDLADQSSPNYQVIHTLSPVIINEMPQHHDASQPTHSWLGVPLIFNEQPVGMLALDKNEPHFYRQEHARLALAFATQAATAMENARLFAAEEQRAQALAASLEQQRELDQLKSEFIQNVSHELRTPLAIARGYAELLYEGELGPLTPEQQHPMGIIVRRLQMLTKLIGNINATLEIETQREHHELVDLAQITQAIVDDFQTPMHKAKLTLESDIASNLPPIIGDPVHLRRVLDNLLGNALKFTPEGGQVTLTLHREGAFLRLEITDTGIGIPEDQLDRIFIRFYQVDGSASRRYGGAGLGLSLVKEVVESLGGAVSVISTEGHGSTFTVKFPIAEAQDA